MKQTTPLALLKRKGSFEKWARETVNEYLKKLLLTRHTVIIEPITKASKEGTYMECAFRHPYLDTVIRYNPTTVLDDWDDRDLTTLKHALIHELCHIITDPLYALSGDRFVSKNQLEDTRETLTDHIAMIVSQSNL